MDFKKIFNYYKEKRINDMQELNTKIYSKKICQKLILKCVMKLILKNKLPSIDTFKQSVKTMLISNKYDNESIIKHLESMINSQIVSCIDLANKTIEKYKYNYEYEIVVDELDFNPSKFIKKEPRQSPGFSSIYNVTRRYNLQSYNSRHRLCLPLIYF